MAHFFPSGSRLDTERKPPRVRRILSRSTKASDAPEHRYGGPSHINWLCNNASSPSIPNTPQRPPSAHTLGRSASLSALALSPPLYRHPSLTSNRSLQLDMMTDARALDVDGNPALLHVKPLSPIFERAHYHVEGGLLDEALREPETPASFGDHGSTYSAFLRRPLKRTVSQASTSSLRTVGTGTGACNVATLPAPSLPVLDLRPPFTASHRTGPQLFSTVYEDAASERTGSFVTARSIGSPDGEEDIAASSPSDPPPLPPITYPPHSSPEPDSEGTMVAPTPRPRRTSTSESFIWRRWMKGLSFGSTRPRFSLLVPTALLKARAPLPALLFWAGFLAPWCWLIGGWLVAEGRLDEKGDGPILPVWKIHSTDALGKERTPPDEKPREAAAEAGSELRAWWKGWTSTFRRARAAVGEPKPPVQPPLRQRAEAWVVRCRVAAVASGALILIAFVVAVIVAGGTK
ncbi:hypothetical protein BV25DRAFT_1830180 [Artomyces pyxidatus]|uniref:Uncharacterized protein n=1 Tax=Artomyces pyxidatus TaxID=48021 RepID=A0ACB8SQI9_9AGAM|nr:hypothetical protein BV25DRAFT_1830180 [Artomyces pyxidatus]